MAKYSWRHYLFLVTLYVIVIIKPNDEILSQMLRMPSSSPSSSDGTVISCQYSKYVWRYGVTEHFWCRPGHNDGECRHQIVILFKVVNDVAPWLRVNQNAHVNETQTHSHPHQPLIVVNSDRYVRYSNFFCTYSAIFVFGLLKQVIEIS